jgi:hypothetical protein
MIGGTVARMIYRRKPDMLGIRWQHADRYSLRFLFPAKVPGFFAYVVMNSYASAT